LKNKIIKEKFSLYKKINDFITLTPINANNQQIVKMAFLLPHRVGAITVKKRITDKKFKITKGTK
jgi:hypothetical protein